MKHLRPLVALFGAASLTAMAIPAAADAQTWIKNWEYNPLADAQGAVAATAAPGSFTPQGLVDGKGSQWSKDATNRLAVVASSGDGSQYLIRSNYSQLDMKTDVTAVQNAGTPVLCVGVDATGSGSTAAGYVGCQLGNNGAWQISKVVAGASTVLAQGALAVFPTAQNYKMSMSAVQSTSGTATKTLTLGIVDGSGATLLAPQTITDTTAALQNVPGSTDIFEASGTNAGYAGISDIVTYTDVSGVYVAPNDPGLHYTNNYLVTSNSAITNNGGALMSTTINGNTPITLNFNTYNMPTNAVTQIKYRIDGTSWIQADIAASMPLTLPQFYSQYSQHSLEMEIKALSNGNQPAQVLNRWNIALANSPAVIFNGITLAAGSTVSVPVFAPKELCYLGDSLSAGYRVFAASGGISDPYWSDATMSSEFITAQNLGYEPNINAYEGTGFATGGTTSTNYVPAGPGFVNSYYAGSPARNWSRCAAVVVLFGGNDGATNVTSAVTSEFNTIEANTAASVPIVFLQETTAQASFVQAGIAATTRPSQVTYVSLVPTILQACTSGVNSVDGTHCTAAANITLGAPTLTSVLKPIVQPTTSVAAPVLRPVFH